VEEHCPRCSSVIGNKAIKKKKKTKKKKKRTKGSGRGIRRIEKTPVAWGKSNEYKKRVRELG